MVSNSLQLMVSTTCCASGRRLRPFLDGLWKAIFRELSSSGEISIMIEKYFWAQSNLVPVASRSSHVSEIFSPCYFGIAIRSNRPKTIDHFVVILKREEHHGEKKSFPCPAWPPSVIRQFELEAITSASSFNRPLFCWSCAAVGA
jgi:hypothetical protein